jgi:hypothetical protein
MGTFKTVATALALGALGLSTTGTALSSTRETNETDHDTVRTAFVVLSQTRTVHIDGQLTLEDTTGGDPLVASDQRDDETKISNFWDADLHVGIGFDLDGQIFANGSSTQRSTPGGHDIRFNAITDVNVSGFANEPYYPRGRGNSSTTFQSVFDVRRGMKVDLTMDSNLFGSNDQQNYTFCLWSKTASEVIWADTVVYDDDGPRRNFTERFELPAGRYVLDVRVAARSTLDGEFSLAGRTSATFSIVPVR